jgi:hypothetical protein
MKRTSANVARSNGENTPSQQRGLRAPWGPGQSGNPAGRPKGSRNRLGGAFVSDLYADWQQHGPAVIEQVRLSRPNDYLRVVASLVPREVEVEGWSIQELSDEALLDLIVALQATQLE